jgi:hypothetical protein
MALELLVNTPAVANCIREGKTFMLNGVMQTGKNVGMITMDDSLRNLYSKGLITREECESRAEDKVVMKKPSSSPDPSPLFHHPDPEHVNCPPMPIIDQLLPPLIELGGSDFTSARGSHLKSASTAASSPSRCHPRRRRRWRP